jgi:hypothetical protein
MVVMKGMQYRKCILCGKNKVAPISRTPLRYPKKGVCAACTRSPDFDKKMKELK